MKIQDLNGKKVCILGFGKEGQAMLEALEEYAPSASITIADKDATLRVSKYTVQTGEDYLENLDAFDAVIKSPGIPSRKLTADSRKLTSSTQIFLDTIADTGATIIGVTGSKGKSTTSSLIAAILKKGGKKVHLIGNVGDPSILHISDAKADAFFVMEMSSFQLEGLTCSPHIAVVTSFFPEHLDHHGSIEKYLEAKQQIALHQSVDDVVFFAASSPGAADIAKEGGGVKIPLWPTDCPIDLTETHLIGTHNESNVALAYAVAKYIGIKDMKSLAAIKQFQPLPHRLQSLGTHHQMEWVDDAISTTPDSTIAALDALEGRVKIIILGGQDRGLEFSALAKRITASEIETVILLGESGRRIHEALILAGAKQPIVDADSMDSAVQLAKEHTVKKGIVLLSPASPSYDMFKNFEAKGEAFKSRITA